MVLAFHMYEYFACMCVSGTYVPGAQKHQKRTSDLLELDLQMFLNHHVVVGNQTSSS